MQFPYVAREGAVTVGAGFALAFQPWITPEINQVLSENGPPPLPVNPITLRICQSWAMPPLRAFSEVVIFVEWITECRRADTFGDRIGREKIGGHTV